MTNEERAAKIRSLMTEQKVSVSQLARDAGIHRNTVYHVLDGEHNVDIVTLLKVAEALECPATMLV